MGKQKSRSSRTSHGGRQKSNLAHEQKRQAKFAAKRGTDKEYKYKKNPYNPGTKEYEEERLARIEKAKSSRLPYARWRSIFAKLDNLIAEQEQKLKNFKNKEIREIE